MVEGVVQKHSLFLNMRVKGYLSCIYGVGMNMQHTVMKFIEKHHLLTKNSTVLIAVSGGPDSMALLHFYQSIQEEWNLNLVAVSVDHQLRGSQSKADIEHVREFCKEWHVEFVTTAIDVLSYKQENKVGTQVAARELRYQFFAEQMKLYQADYLAFGHHADDQIETMLMGFVRSTSPIALSGIPVKRAFASGYIVRPFLSVAKADLITYCSDHQIDVRIDLSNEDTTYTRNFFRKHLIPTMKEKNDNIHTTIQRLSEKLQSDEEFIRSQARNMIEKVIQLDDEQRKISFQIKRFKLYPLSLQRRGYHLILDYLYHHLPSNLSYVHEEAFFSLLEDHQGNGIIDFPHDLQIEKSYDWIIFSFSNQRPQNTAFQKVLHIPSNLDLPNGSKLIATYTDEPPKVDPYLWGSAVKDIDFPLYIRTREPGDRISWPGLNGSKKVKDVFIDEKIPRRDRDGWPLLVNAKGEVLWMMGLKKGGFIDQKEKESSYVQLKYIKPNIEEV